MKRFTILGTALVMMMAVACNKSEMASPSTDNGNTELRRGRAEEVRVRNTDTRDDNVRRGERARTADERTRGNDERRTPNTRPSNLPNNPTTRRIYNARTHNNRPHRGR
ncbi:MAG: hypothetical protein KDC11_07970 [Chitinophagaceae bacterium]|nr:hypothetical protein [Chitinophagaceae bacterium]